VAADPHAPFLLENVGVGHRAIGPRRVASWAALGLGLGGLVVAWPDGDYGLPAAIASVGAAFLAWYYAASWTNLWSPPAIEGEGLVRVDGDRLAIEARGRRFAMPLARVDKRTSWQDRRGFVTHFRAKNGDAITVVHARPEAAQALLQATGERVHLDRMRLSSWVQRGAGREGLVGLALVLCATVMPVVVSAVAVALSVGGASVLTWAAASGVALALIGSLVYAADRAIAEPELVVGSDGLRVRGAVARRFLRYKDLEAARLDEHGIRLTLRGGATELLPMWRHGMWGLPADPAADRQAREGPLATELLHRRARVLERIQAGIAARGQALLGDAQLVLLERRGRSSAEWRSAMDALLARSEGGYREVRLDPDALARVAENPAQPADRRVGAALALARTDDPGVRQRLRFAVETCADERLRASLERAMQGEVAEEDLAAVEAEAAAQSERVAARAAR
jgi:hypothetical protein